MSEPTREARLAELAERMRRVRRDRNDPTVSIRRFVAGVVAVPWEEWADDVEAAARPPDPDALREAIVQAVAVGIAGEHNGLGLTWNQSVMLGQKIARAALAASACNVCAANPLLCSAHRPPDLAALLHPWTCGWMDKYEHDHPDTDGGWLCERAAADIAFRLRTTQETT